MDEWFCDHHHAPPYIPIQRHITVFAILYYSNNANKNRCFCSDVAFGANFDSINKKIKFFYDFSSYPAIIKI